MRAGVLCLVLIALITFAGCVKEISPSPLDYHINYSITYLEYPEDRCNLNEVVINGNDLRIRSFFTKPTPCDKTNYSVTNENSIVKIVPRLITSGPGCMQIVGAEAVEINLTLPNGTYMLQLYGFWNPCISSSEQTFFDEKIIVGEPIGDPHMFSCELNEDCVKAGEGCCGCSRGGFATAINSAYLDEWEESQNRCDCAGIGSIHRTCFAKPRCLNGTCTLIKSSLELTGFLHPGSVWSYGIGNEDYEMQLSKADSDSVVFNIDGVDMRPLTVGDSVILEGGMILTPLKIYFDEEFRAVEFRLGE